MSTSLFAVTQSDVPEARHKGHDRKCTQCGERLPHEPARGRVAKHSLCADCALDGLPHTD
jgi:formylmethanofuran dehydrogenase subunit E